MENYRNLRRVREQRRFELEEVASSAGISAERLLAFEDGDKAPSFRQLEKLAELYGIPVYAFAIESTPNLPETLLDFRRSDPSPARISPRGAKRLWAADSVSRFSRQLAIAVEYKTPSWSKELKSQDISQKRAVDLRTFFETWLDQRSDGFDFAGDDTQVFLGGLRLFIELSGVIVNINDAPYKDFLGFHIVPDHGMPLIYVNRSISSKKAQLFTLVHELAHRLSHREGISDPFVAKNKLEKSCNKFAANFLAPMDSFELLVSRQDRNSRTDPDKLISIVSNNSLLSRHAAALRLQEGQFIKEADLRAWERKNRVNPKEEKEEEQEALGDTFGLPHAKRIGELGYLPTYLASIAVQKKIVDGLDVQEGMFLAENIQEKAFNLVNRRVKVALG